MRLLPSALRFHLWEDCIPKASTWPPFLSLPLPTNLNCKAFFPYSVILISLIRKIVAEGKEAMSDCWSTTHTCQHMASIMFCLWFYPWPLTLTPSCLTPSGLSTQSSDPRSNQSDRATPAPIASPCWVSNCVRRCLLTLRQRHRNTLELSTSSSSIKFWRKPSEWHVAGYMICILLLLIDVIPTISCGADVSFWSFLWGTNIYLVYW